MSGDSKIVPIASRRPRPAESPAAAAPRTFEETLGAHLDALYSTARFLCRDSAAADDLVQMTALRAFRAWSGLRSPNAARAWLFKILRHTFLNTRRDEARRPRVVDLDLDELLGNPILEPETPSAVIDQSLPEHISAALEALPPGFRDVVWLIDVEELTIAEVAEVLDVPTGTVASRVHRGRRLLREALLAHRGSP